MCVSDPIAAIAPVENQHRTRAARIASSAADSAFGKVLAKVLDTVSPEHSRPIHEVKKGDTLSAICKSALTVDGKSPSQTEIAAAVKRVSECNHLQSADRISVGQKIDLTAATAHETGRGGRATSWNPRLSDITGIIKGIGHTDDLEKLSIVESGGNITSNYGFRLNPFTNRPEHHDGVDFAAEKGTRVFAAMPGKVVFSGWQSGYGKTVMVRHADGSETLYAHNSANLVKVGQEIDSGTPIAKVGSTGNSTGPHVHFEWRLHGRTVNPTEQFDKQLLQVTKALKGLDVLS
jgi:murein DD-endopeptidase MepM/ murein hydrolase activator NlpD